MFIKQVVPQACDTFLGSDLKLPIEYQYPPIYIKARLLYAGDRCRFQPNDFSSPCLSW